MQVVTGGFIAENLRSLMGRNSWIFEARAPGYEPASAKIVALFSTTARPAPPRRVLSKMAATKSEHRVFSPKKNSNAYR